jgi:hypothetical protein
MLRSRELLKCSSLQPITAGYNFGRQTAGSAINDRSPKRYIAGGDFDTSLPAYVLLEAQGASPNGT